MKAHAIPTDNVTRGKLRVLIIDNSGAYANQLAGAIQSKADMEVTCAGNIFEAGLMALKFSPNAILINFMSEEIDAHQISSYIHKTEELQDCTLIALAGGLSRNEAENLYAYGFDDVISNSHDVENIISAIQNANCVAR